MRNILVFIIRYHFLLLFVLLEFLSISLLVNSTYYQSSVILKAGSRLTGSFYTSVSNATDYFKLATTNEHLANDVAEDLASPMYATGVGLVIEGLNRYCKEVAEKAENVEEMIDQQEPEDDYSDSPQARPMSFLKKIQEFFEKDDV